MSLRERVFASLLDGPACGYQLLRRFAVESGRAPPRSQLYRELAALAAGGYVDVFVRRSRGGRPRHLHWPNERGLEWFARRLRASGKDDWSDPWHEARHWLRDFARLLGDGESADLGAVLRSRLRYALERRRTLDRRVQLQARLAGWEGHPGESSARFVACPVGRTANSRSSDSRSSSSRSSDFRSSSSRPSKQGTKRDLLHLAAELELHLCVSEIEWLRLLRADWTRWRLRERRLRRGLPAVTPTPGAPQALG